MREATHNLSIAAVKHRPEKVEDDLVNALDEYDVILIQEAGAAKQILSRVVRRTGAKCYSGNGQPGQSSTPILVRKGLKVRFEHHLISPKGLFVGRGAGPDRAKAKWLMVAIVTEPDGTKHAIGNLHGIASPQFSLRGTAQRRMYRKASRIMRKRYKKMHKSLGGDLNAEVGRNTRVPFWKIARLRSTQRILGVLPTHGKRALDDILIDLSLKVVAHGVDKTPSDHDRYWVEVHPKKRKK